MIEIRNLSSIMGGCCGGGGTANGPTPGGTNKPGST